MKSALEAGHSIARQERRAILRLIMILSLISFFGWRIGCRVSDLDLHIKEGALRSVIRTTNVVIIPSSTPLP